MKADRGRCRDSTALSAFVVSSKLLVRVTCRTTTKIEETLLYVRDTSPVNIDELSPERPKLIQDARDIIETAKLIVQEKNADELFQNFVWHTRDVDVIRTKKDPDEVLPDDKSKTKEDGQIGALCLQYFQCSSFSVLTLIDNQ